MTNKNDNKGVKEPFEKASDDVPMLVKLTMLMQLMLARILTGNQEEVPEAKPLVRDDLGHPMEQLQSGKFRFYSPAELGRLLEVTYQLKDIVQTNCLAMRGLEDATAKNDSPEVAELCRSMNELGKNKRVDSETAMGTYMIWLEQVKSFRKSAATLYQPRPGEEKLPIVDCERQLVSDIGDSISRAYQNMYFLQQTLAKAVPVLNIPQLDRITKEYAQHNDKINALVAEVSQFAINSLGQRVTTPAAKQPAPV